jgi:hypothetical protein
VTDTKDMLSNETIKVSTRYAIISEDPIFNTNSLLDIRKIALVRGSITIKERLSNVREKIMLIESDNGKVVNLTTGQHIKESAV